MATPNITITSPNLESFIKAIAETPKVQLRYMRTELSRGVKRIRKSFVAKQLHGRPGLETTKLGKGGNVKAFVQGKSLKDLTGIVGISRLLHVHEKGMIISARRGKWLYIHAKGTQPVKDRPIVAVVPQVVIPKRLHFEKQVKEEAPAMMVKVKEAGERATKVTLQKGLAGHG